MRKNLQLTILFSIAIWSTNDLWSQYGLGTRTPNPASVLEMVANDKGVLIPRVALGTNKAVFGLSGGGTDLSISNGMLVYNTGDTDGNEGFYYWDYNAVGGSGQWKKLATDTGFALDPGGSNDATLRWDGNNWVSDVSFTNDGNNQASTGSLTAGGNIIAEGNLQADSFTTVWVLGRTYDVDDVVLHEGVFYKNVAPANSAPDGTNTDGWLSVSGAQNLQWGSFTGTDTTAKLSISEGNTIEFEVEDGLEFRTKTTTGPSGTMETVLVLKDTRGDDQELKVSSALDGSDEVFKFQIEGHPEKVIDVSDLEEVRSGAGTPATVIAGTTPAPEAGDLYLDTTDNTLWAFDGTGWLAVKADAVNIYTQDGKLSGTRVLGLDGNALTFNNQAGNAILHLDEDRLYAGTSAALSTADVASYEASIPGGGGTGNLDLVVEGDTKTRFLVDKDNQVGKKDQVLVATDSGMKWVNANSLKKYNSLNQSRGEGTAAAPDDTDVLLVIPPDDSDKKFTVTLPPGLYIGHRIEIRREGEGTGTKGEIEITLKTGDPVVPLNVGYQVLTIEYNGTDWVRAGIL